jgi:hypothetical protein
MTQMSRAGYRSVEPVVLPDEEPTVISNVVNVHMTKHGYSIADLSKIAMLTEDEFLARFAPKAQRAPTPHLRSVK